MVFMHLINNPDFLSGYDVSYIPNTLPLTKEGFCLVKVIIPVQAFDNVVSRADLWPEGEGD